MSSGVEADIALDAAVVLSLGMNRVLGRTAGLAGRGAEALAALAAGKAEARAAALAEIEAYDQALRAVLERNARISALATTRDRVGADVALPAPLEPDEGRPLDELTAWCAATDAALDAAEHQISEHLAADVTAQLFAVPAEGLTSDTSASPGPERADAAAYDRDLTKIQQTLERVLARLLPDATDDDRRTVAEAARLIAEAPSEAEAEGVLTEVRLRIQDANRRTEEHRAAERRRAAEREAAEQAEAERRYVLESVTSAFEEMGYEVQTGFETLTAKDGTIVLTKGTWPDHSVKMRIDETVEAISAPASGGPGSAVPGSSGDPGRTVPGSGGPGTGGPGSADSDSGGGVPGQRLIRAAMRRERPAESEDDRRLDVEREREWCEAFEAARAKLAEAGIRSNVTWRLDPGVQELPVNAGARQTRTRTEQRERRRERERSE
ncbi:response regulator receiver protein [Actinomadura rudentiformis]|uniref:response regulator receiver protein n=1 Tax=Actinomadura rudentiformis TaxID=359158 RepID=UPI00178C1E01|nr:response regulator receiver protein [Actinomadura rudentiformis]